jgi:3D (Asp-Asp-Asp) domain-containing protein
MNDPDVQNLLNLANETSTQTSSSSDVTNTSDPDVQNLIDLASKVSDSNSKTSDIDTPTKSALLGGANPQDVQTAKSQLGSQDYDGWCMSFVAKATGSSYKGNAIDNWYESPNKVAGTLEGIQPGDRIFFTGPQTGPEKGLGHVGLYEGLGKFISATDNGVAEYSISKWNSITGQTVLGYVPN